MIHRILYNFIFIFQPKLVDIIFFPTIITNLGIEKELREFMTEVEKAFHETGMPMFPCFLHHFCLPFSPICAMLYCASQRKSKLEELVQNFNNDTGTDRINIMNP